MWSYQFKAKCKSQVTELSVKEMQQASCMWGQQSKYKEDYEQLKALPKSGRLLKLDPYDRTDHVIRVDGRLQFADIPEETKLQIILPGTWTYRSCKDDTGCPQTDVTCQSRNLEAENLDNPRKTQSQAHHQKMCYFFKRVGLCG